MKKVELRNLVKIAATIFVLYLCIHYWSHAANLIKTLFAAALPLIIGAVIAFPLNILMSFYERHYFPSSKSKAVVRSRRGVCIALAILTLVAILALVIALVVPQVTSCVKLLVAEVPDFFNLVVEKLSEFEFVPEDIIATLSSIDWQSRISDILKTVGSGLGSVMDVVVSTVSTVVSGVTTAFLAIIFAVYLLMSKDKLGSQLKRVIKHYVPDRFSERFTYVLSVANDSFRKFIVAQCTEAVILGLLCTVGMFILRLPYAAMIGAVTAVTAFIPVVGALIGGAIGAFLILMESPVKALIFLIFIILLQQIEGDLIYPKVVGSSIGLPGIWVLAAVTVGGGMFGVMGMMLSVPVASTVYRLIRNDLNGTDEICTEAVVPEKEAVPVPSDESSRE
ncbi:MAG: AI-2E family transporter [Clostridia bacterium]|nr:AI-2E family transporter [Clostridia bacterium]